MSVLAPPQSHEELEALIREARARQRRRRVQLATVVLAVAGLGLAVWAAVPNGGGAASRHRGPVDAAAASDISAAGTHIGISYVATSGGVTWVANSSYDPRAFWLTTDNGRSWRRLRLPARAYALNPRATYGSIQFVDRRHGWVSLGYRVYRTADGGRTWQISVAGPRCLAPRCGGVTDFSFRDARHGTAWVVVLSQQPHELWRTNDGGRTWRLVRRWKYVGQSMSLDGRNGLAAVQGPGVLGPYSGPPVGALYRTTDGGRTWSQYFIAGSKSWIELPIGVFGRQVLVVQNAPNPGDGGINLRVGTVWSTVDEGRHWEGAAVPPEVELPSSFSLASPRFWAFAAQRGNDLYVTSNAGHSWRKLHVRGLPSRGPNAFGTQISGLAFTSPTVGWAIASGRFPGVTGNSALIRTTDGGLHWKVNGPRARH